MATNGRKAKIEYSQLTTGYEFPPASFRLDSVMVADYLKALEEAGSYYRDNELVPPLAVAASAMASLSEAISLPPGTIHVSQEIEFSGTVSTEDTLTSYTKVSRKQDRGKLHLLNIDFKVLNQKQQTVLSAKAGFILPEGDKT